jgi:hypothetical protein
MAFRHPSLHTPQRPYTAPDETQSQVQPQSRLQIEPQSQQTHSLGDSQEWVLFSPTSTAASGLTYAISTGPTRTAGHSRVSDFGSLDTAARSHGYDEGSENTDEALEGEEGGEEEEEDEELDSLDSHLHEFRTEPSVYRGEMSGSVLPTHDGLGSFRIDGMMTGEVVQDHLYTFERFNPRRVKRRRSTNAEAEDGESEQVVGAERTRRIEAWRMEQSRLLVDEIQRETRRRRLSISSEKRSLLYEREQEDVATLSNVEGSLVGEAPTEDDAGFWSRITNRVIRELLGVDDDLLSIIFGESLPGDDDLSTTPRAHASIHAAHSLIAKNQQYSESSWEYRLLDRIARELGILVNQLSDHPGAFTTYVRTQTEPLPYAGLPVIPETTRDPPTPSVPQESRQSQSLAAEFQPTLQNTTQPIAIPLTNTSLSEPLLAPGDITPRANQPLSREEWEADLDIKLVFRYLRDRFVSKFGSPSSISPGLHSHGTSHLATSHTAENAARAARVRQYHPLVHPSHNHARERERLRAKTWRATVPPNGSAVARDAIHIRRRSSSCASEGKISGLRLGARRSGSSRHYWDFGHSSVGSGGITSAGVMGSWGGV